MILFFECFCKRIINAIHFIFNTEHDMLHSNTKIHYMEIRLHLPELEHE